jgi:CheY-like chemotaxis protein
VKFTPEQGRVEVTLAPDGDFAVLTVTDTGEGISADFVPHVFERFRQADGSTTRRHSGLGLGLSIVQHLVELHGGTVRVESDGLGKGSRFMVRLPREKTTAAAAEALRAAAELPEGEPSIEGVRVLLVDDEPDTLEVVAQLLRRRGARVTARNSVFEAMAALRQATQPFDVLVSDIGMPGQDGYSLVRQVRNLEREHLKKLPAVALTAYARGEDRLRAISEGFQEHLPKPVDPVELAGVVANLTKQRAGKE